MSTKVRLDYLTNPKIPTVNALPNRSDFTFSDPELGENNDLCLDGTWKGYYDTDYNPSAVNYLEPTMRLPHVLPARNTKESGPKLQDLKVPDIAELQTLARPQYVNTQYPWDGVEKLIPGQVPEHNPFVAYYKDFTLSKKFMTNRFLELVFDGVLCNYYVYLNGEFVGYSARCFSPTRFDITKLVKNGKNRLAVLVFKYGTGAWLRDQDYWRVFGIFRSVHIYSHPLNRLTDVRVNADLTPDYKNGKLTVDIKGLAPERNLLMLQVKEGRNVLFKTSGTLENGTAHFEGIVEGIKPWSAEIPNLYKLRIELKVAGKEVEVVPVEIGFRSLKIEDGIFKINGKRLVIHGVNKPDFDTNHGPALSQDDIEFDIRYFRKNNINTIRTAHQPTDHRYYPLCDKYGVYIIDEADLETHGTWQELRGQYAWNRLKEEDCPMRNPDWETIILDREESLVARDYNHPSVIIWSLGNESSAGINSTKAHDLVRSLDPSRPVHYESCWNVPGHEHDSDFYSRMYAKPKEIDEYINSDKCDRPMIECEFEHAMGSSLGNFDEYIEREEKYPNYQGGCIWDYMDQAIYGESYGGDFLDKPNDFNFNCNGLILTREDAYDSPKTYEARFAYSPLKIAVKDGVVTVTNKNLFQSTKDYSFFYNILDDGEVVSTIKFKLDVEPGETKTYEVNAKNIKVKGEKVESVEAYRHEKLFNEAYDQLIAFGQNVVGGSIEELGAKPERAVGKNLKQIYIPGGYNEGLKTVDGSTQILDMGIGVSGVYKLKVNGHDDILAKRIQPTFWRASTDNDQGNGFAANASLFYAASKFMVSPGTAIEHRVNDNGTNTLVNTYTFPAIPDLTVKIAYTLEKDGAVRVDCDYSGTKLVPAGLPLFGVRLPLAALEFVDRYYGCYQVCYADRHLCGRLGEWTNVPCYGAMGDQPMNEGYCQVCCSNPRPQDCNNFYGVRHLIIRTRNETHTELKISAIDKPFQFKYTLQDEFEIENADHLSNLPYLEYPTGSFLTIIGFERGVGGDDSWGAPVHEQYTIPADKPLHFAFRLEANK